MVKVYIKERINDQTTVCAGGVTGNTTYLGGSGRVVLLTMLNLYPTSSLIDPITQINVSRLQPLQNITLEARIVGEKGETFESHAHFIADKDGEVDVCRDSSFGGSYRGVSAMGLLWSMKPAPGQRKGIRLMKSDVTKPYDIVLNCFDDHVTPSESSLQPLSSVTFQKWYMAEGVKRIPVREGRIRGTLFLPAGDGPFPGSQMCDCSRTP